MTHGRHLLTESPRYRGFIAERDRALETLHTKAQLRIADVLRAAFTHVLEIVSLRYPVIVGHFYHGRIATQTMQSIEQSINMMIPAAANEIARIVMRLRRHSYLLAQAGELEAQARSGINGRHAITKDELDRIMWSRTASGENLTARIELGLSRVKRDVLDAVEMSRVLEEPQDIAIDRVRDAFPNKRRVIQPKRILKEKVLHREADPLPKVIDVAPTFIDQDEWNDLLDDYTKEFIPSFRSPDSVIDVETPGQPELTEWYGWEIEQQITHDFVEKVRDGEIEAANKNGINDFVWIAIIDNKTDECCLWRDGLLTSEIEAKLKDHEDDDCDDATEPPAHFNCRCRLAVATEQIPEPPAVDTAGFEDWLMNP